MTKKDFELIASVLRARNGASQLGNGPMAQAHERFLQLQAEAFADALATTNPRFDRTRFILAATGKDAYGSAGRLVHYS